MTGSSLRDPDVARTFLFVPGDRPDRFERAAASGTEQVIVDLEDAVDPESKDIARDHARRWLTSAGRGVVRINAAQSPWFDADCAALAGLGGLDAVMVPKSEDPARLTALSHAFGPTVRIIALVESARGIDAAARIAAADGVSRLAFGSIDLAADLGCDHTRDALLLARSTLVLASRSAGIAPPIDGVTTDLDDLEVISDDARYSRSLGFRGKLCIHPKQLAATVSAFMPTATEFAWAERVLAASSGDGAVRVDGEMVDRPVLERARRIVNEARATNSPEES